MSLHKPINPYSHLKVYRSTADPSPWNYKPWWCQPWSILLTGILIVSGCWLLTKSVWLMIGVSVPIVVWWFYFLILWPKLIQAQLNDYFQAEE